MDLLNNIWDSDSDTSESIISLESNDLFINSFFEENSEDKDEYKSDEDDDIFDLNNVIITKEKNNNFIINKSTENIITILELINIIKKL